MKQNRITFILTLYKPTLNELNYWKQAHKMIVQNNHQFIIANDNTSIKYSKEDFKYADIKNNDINMGKLNSVLNTRSIWKNKFIKTLDPDDFVSIARIEEVAKLLKEESIYRMVSYRIKKPLKNINQNYIEEKFNKIIPLRFNSLGTSWTILPAKGFTDEKKFPINDVYINEDQMLGQICLAQGFKIKDIKKGFYLYLVENGVSNVKNIQNYLNSVVVTINEYKRLRYNFEYTNPFVWPNLNYYKYLIFKNIFNRQKVRRLYSKIIRANNQEERRLKERYDQTTNVTFISDKNQMLYSITNAHMIFSQFTSDKSKLKINLILSDIDACDQRNIVEIINKLGIDKSVNLIFIKSSDFFKMNSKIKHITNTTNIRLFLSSILKDTNRTIYLDNDTVVSGSIDQAYRFFEKEKNYGRRWDELSPWVSYANSKKWVKNHSYFNAGVLHLNLDMIRKNNLEKKFIKFYRKNRFLIKYADQDILNSCLDIQDMPWFFNIARDSWPKTYEWLEDKIDLKIYHFLSNNKQWDNDVKSKKKTGDLSDNEIKNMEPYKKIWNNFYLNILKIWENKTNGE